jgi:hypothetical protein
MKKELCVKLVIYKDRISWFVHTRHISQYVEPVSHLLTISVITSDILTGEIMLYSGNIITDKEAYRLGPA